MKSGLAAIAVVTSVVSVSQAVLISNFEAPTYTADSNPAGTDSWVTYGGGGTIAPNSGGYNAAYGAIPQGSQSFISGNSNSIYVRPLPAGINLIDGVSLDWLLWQEIQAGNNYAGLADGVGSANPVAAVGINAAGNFQLLGAGAPTDTEIAADYGTGAGADHYRIKIVLDITNQQFQAYATKVYPTGETTIDLGSKDFLLAPGSSLTSVGGITGGTSPAFTIHRVTGSYFAIDDININPVPEPATLGVLMMGGALALRRRSRV